MSLGSPAQIGQILLLLIGALAVTALARKKGWPSPPLVVAVGLVVSFVPGVPQFQISPPVLLGVVLPPLLYSTTLDSSARDFRRNLYPIASLGIGLVIASAVVVALVAHLLIPDMPFAAALVLGAVVAPPDAVAAVAIGRRLNLPGTVMSILSGESLINDGSALTLYKVALAGVGGATAYLTDGLRDFALAIGVGLLVGLGIAIPVQWIRARLDDAVLESAIDLILPFGAYLVANAFDGSGVIAVVAAGLYLSYNLPKAGYASRLQEEPVWKTLGMLLEAIVFGLIGLQLRFVVQNLISSGRDLGTVLVLCVAVFVALIAVRFAWIFGASIGQRWITRRQPYGRPLWGAYTVISWAGMRGVVTLAAAAAIPVTVGNPAMPFPFRDLILLLAFVVTVGTLLLQGLTLPALIRALHLAVPPDPERSARVEAHLASETRKAALARLDELRPRWEKEMGAERADRLVQLSTRMIDRRQQALESADEQSERAEAGGDGSGVPTRELQAWFRQIARTYLDVQREVIMRERDAGHVDYVTVRRLFRDLDYQEAFMNDLGDRDL